MLSVAVTVNVTVPADVGVPLSAPLGLSVRPSDKPLAVKVQQVAVPSLVVAENCSAGYATPTSPWGNGGTVIEMMVCPLAAAAHTNASITAPIHLIDKRVMGSPGAV